jgi:hypothetical protein
MYLWEEDVGPWDPPFNQKTDDVRRIILLCRYIELIEILSTSSGEAQIRAHPSLTPINIS